MASRIAARAQLVAVRFIARLPDRVKVALSGEPPLVVDGDRLDPQVQLLRSLRRRRGFTGLIHPSIAAGRARYRRETRLFRGPITAVEDVRDFEIPGPAGPLRARLYSSAARRAPLLVYLHGGGFVIGDLDTHDEPCRLFCRHAGTHVLSVDYRLAPEHPFPAGLDDAIKAFEWARANAESLGADPARVGVGGDSAGANLAAGVALAREGVAAQLLIYPATDMTTARASHQLFGEGFLLTLADRDAFYRHYTRATGVRREDPRVSPMNAPDLSPAPPALVVLAGFDILRDEGEAYANRLRRAGVPVRTLRYAGFEHGFIHLTGVCPAARRAMVAIAGEWRDIAAMGQAALVGQAVS
jgi:acetyl esterase